MAVENDSYCAAADVERWTQVGAYADGGSATTPTLAQVLEFQQNRAGDIYSVLFATLGTLAPGPAAFSVTIDTSTNQGKALDAVCVHANAIGAAADALMAGGAGEGPARSERVGELMVMYNEALEAVRRAATMYQGFTSQSATHISTGEITVATVVAREEDGIVFNGATEF